MADEKLKGMKRREFLKGAVIGTGALALSGLGSTSAEAAQRPEKMGRRS